MILIYGGTGFIGNYIVSELNKHNILYKLSSKRIYKYDDVMDDINQYIHFHF